MSTPRHEAFVSLFTFAPKVLDSLACLPYGQEPHAPATWRVEAVELTVDGMHETPADVVLTRWARGANGPQCAVVVEIQLEADEDRRAQWFGFVARTTERFGCRTDLVVITDDRDIAAWASAPLADADGSLLWPLVVGPDQVPVIILSKER